MSSKGLLQDTLAIQKLAEILARCPEVRKFDTEENREAWALAHAFSDLEGSFLKFIEKQLPVLIQSQLEASEIKELLIQMGEELRHILYHIKDSKFYQYLYQEYE